MAVLFLAAGLAQAQPFTTNFTSGSTGNVPLIVNGNVTNDLPPDGILHYSTITINPGATLRFNPNALNTPVYLLARSNVLINGTIDVSGKPSNARIPGDGGPGGFRGGYGAPVETPPVRGGDGKGPAGGIGGGSFANGGHGNFPYGNALCTPLVGGSGGGGGGPYTSNQGEGGGGGGGAILIASGNWITNNGIVQALGGLAPTGGIPPNRGGSGSGGAIRLVAPLVSGSGNGSLNVSGANLGNQGFSPAGRVRIDSTNVTESRQVQMIPNNAASATRGSQGFVFPEPNFLTITNVTIGNQTWVLHPSTNFSISLPAGPAVNALVQIVASGSFYSNSFVPIAVVVTPDQGATTNYLSAISLSNNAGSTNVTVTIPTGTTSTLHVWTR